jgi:hypothetical protein
VRAGGDGGFGPWAPMAVEELAALLAGVGTVWWLAGGVALDRFVGRGTREHGDIDVEIPRLGLQAVVDHLPGWYPETAHDGVLTPLTRAADQPDEAGGVWWRDEVGGPWRFDMRLATVDGDDWVYRRHPALRRPLASVWWTDGDGVPVIAPEVQLLFKARSPRARDLADAEVVVPLLDGPARTWLRQAVATAHPDTPWLPLL